MTSNPLRGIMDANKLTGPNFSDWLRNLKIVLMCEKLAYVLEANDPQEPTADSSEEEVILYQAWKEDSVKVQCYMLGSMSNELQRQHDNMEPKTILTHLKELFGEQSRTERYEISKKIFRNRMSEGASVQTHVLRMIEWIERLAVLGFKMDKDLSIDLILQSLPDSYSQFIINFNMNKIDVTLAELLNMLKTAEGTLQKEKPNVLMIGKTNKRKPGQALKQGKNKKLKKTKQVEHKAKAKGQCFHCKKEGH